MKMRYPTQAELDAIAAKVDSRPPKPRPFGWPALIKALIDGKQRPLHLRSVKVIDIFTYGHVRRFLAEVDERLRATPDAKIRFEVEIQFEDYVEQYDATHELRRIASEDEHDDSPLTALDLGFKIGSANLTNPGEAWNGFARFVMRKLESKAA